MAASVIGIVHYCHNRVEHIGKLVVFPIWEKIRIGGFAACCRLFFGVYGYQNFTGGISNYWLGLIFGTLFGYVMIKMVNRLRVRF